MTAVAAQPICTIVGSPCGGGGREGQRGGEFEGEAAAGAGARRQARAPRRPSSPPARPGRRARWRGRRRRPRRRRRPARERGARCGRVSGWAEIRGQSGTPIGPRYAGAPTSGPGAPEAPLRAANCASTPAVSAPAGARRGARAAHRSPTRLLLLLERHDAHGARRGPPAASGLRGPQGRGGLQRRAGGRHLGDWAAGRVVGEAKGREGARSRQRRWIELGRRGGAGEPKSERKASPINLNFCPPPTAGAPAAAMGAHRPAAA
jgi:hypothetical protein